MAQDPSSSESRGVDAFMDEALIDEKLVEALEGLAAWEGDQALGDLTRFLPTGDHRLRSFVLAELIKMHMAMEAESGRSPDLAGYFDAMPDLITAESAPLDLVMEEIQLKIESGDSPCLDAYVQQYPRFESMLRPLLGNVEATSPTKKIRKPSEMPAGTLVDDFEIVRTLGKGAFAHVYLAKQISMTRLVALKVSSGTCDEPQALAQFDHPNIVRVFDQRHVDEPEVHLLYMQFHPGGTLADVVKQVRVAGAGAVTGKLLINTIDHSLLASAQVVPDRSSVRDWIATADWPRLVAWMGIQMAEALAEAHRVGVLHRDVKPANVLLTAEGIPQLADFNVSFAGSAGRAGAASSFGGSVGYMSPEHLAAIAPQAVATSLVPEGQPVDERSDIYSLGVMLWELWQGHRPFSCSDHPGTSWTDLVKGQYESRHRELISPSRDGTASERVLETSLRSALALDPADRPISGTEMAGRLRLAMHPEAAALFDPPERSISHRLMQWSPWWLATACILVPNIAAGVFNYQYNSLEIATTQETFDALQEFSIWVNSIAFPIAVFLMIWYTRASVKALQLARRGLSVSDDQLRSTLDLGHRAAMIGGVCWTVAGIVYPVLLRLRFPDFSLQDASHFFVSLLICGGVAMIYPLFGLGLLAAYVYYPQMVRPTMRDHHFDAHAARLIARSETYLLIAAIIPLLGAVLMISGKSESRGFMLMAIAAGVGGLLGSFFAYRAITRAWNRMSEVLSTKESTMVG